MTKSVFIAIEGGDGSGKATQSALLVKYAEETLKKNVLKVSFPRYGQPSAYYAGKYLDGAYGSADNVPADLASLTYAFDRFAAKNEIQACLNQPNSMVIADRYVASNLAHQGTKFDSESDRHDYYARMMQTEYETLGVPRPDINIVLIMPVDLAQSNVDKKDIRSYTDKKRDIHESDPMHLERAKANYEELCKLYPTEFVAVQCIDSDGSMRSIDDIQQEIRSVLSI
jgi:dTMP kinase